MLKSLYRKVCSATVVLTVSMSLTGGLHAHDGEAQSKNTKDIEAHREMDFGFDGFDTLNKRLQRDFEEFRLDTGAAEYMRGSEMAAAPSSYLTGQWSPVFNLPIVPIHNAVLPTGKILMWDSVGDLPSELYEVHDTTRSIIWDPATGVATRFDLNTGKNIFCAGHAALPDGRQFIAGGNLNSALDGLNAIHTFNPFLTTWDFLGPMQQGGRWYPSVTALANGDMLITAGGPATPEVFNLESGLRSLTTATLAMPYYPWMQAAPNGETLYFGPDDRLSYLNIGGTGSWDHLGTRDGIDRNYGSYAMYDTGKVLVAGGAGSVKHTAVVDFTQGTPRVSRTDDLNAGRRQHNLTVLPNGSVLATGGNSSGAGSVDLNAGVYTAELWNPATGA